MYEYIWITEGIFAKSMQFNIAISAAGKMLESDDVTDLGHLNRNTFIQTSLFKRWHFALTA